VTRSLRHLRVLLAASAVIAAVVVIADASRLWLAAGPALLGVLDVAMFSGPVVRYRHRVVAGTAARLRLLSSVESLRSLWEFPVALLVVGAGLVVLGGTLSLSTAVRVVLAAVGVAALVATLGRLFFRTYLHNLRLPDEVASPGLVPPASVLVDAADLGRLKTFLSAGTPFTLVAFAAAPECSDSLDRWLLRGRARVLAAAQHNIIEGRPYCHIALAGPGRRLVLADDETRHLLLSLLQGDTAREFSVSIGIATYPADGESLDQLTDKAFAVAAPLVAGL
jgi:hypothetical protein